MVAMLTRNKSSNQFNYRPTMRSSLSLASERRRRHRSMVKMVLALLRIEVNEDIIADNITAIRNPRRPAELKSLSIVTYMDCMEENVFL